MGLGFRQKLGWEMGFGQNFGWEMGFVTPPSGPSGNDIPVKGELFFILSILPLEGLTYILSAYYLGSDLLVVIYFSETAVDASRNFK